MSSRPASELKDSSKNQVTDEKNTKKEHIIMQEIINRPSLSDSGTGTRKRAARSKPVREPWTQAEGTPAVIASGLFALRLRAMPNSVPDFARVVSDLSPAYLRFCELMNVDPVDISDEYAIIDMQGHLEKLLGQERMVDIYEDYEGDGTFHFIYLTPLGGSENYGTVFYKPVVDNLLGEPGKAYLELFHKCLRSLKDIYVNDWNDFYEWIYDWKEERTLELEHSEEPEAEDYRYQLDTLQDIYLNGEAQDAMARIRTSEPLNESDIDFTNNGLDPEHPLCKYASGLFNLLKTGKCLSDYAQEPDDSRDYFLSFPEQFCIYYDLDDLFFEHEEHVNNLAQEGIQMPRLIATLSVDMESVPQHNDPFPALLIQFFDKYGSLADDIQKYQEKGGQPCKE